MDPKKSKINCIQLSYILRKQITEFDHFKALELAFEVYEPAYK